MTLSVNLWRGPEILMTEWELGCAEGLVLAFDSFMEKHSIILKVKQQEDVDSLGSYQS